MHNNVYKPSLTTIPVQNLTQWVKYVCLTHRSDRYHRPLTVKNILIARDFSLLIKFNLTFIYLTIKQYWRKQKLKLICRKINRVCNNYLLLACCKTDMVLACLRGEVRPITTGIAWGVVGSLSDKDLGTCGEKKRVILPEGDVGLCDNFPWNSVFESLPSSSSSVETLLFVTTFVFLFPENIK